MYNIRTIPVLKSSLDIGIIDVRQNLQVLKLGEHAPQPPLLVHLASGKGVWVSLPETCDPVSLRLNLLKLLCSVGDEDLSCFLEALVGEFIEGNARRVCKRCPTSSRANWKLASSHELALESRNMDCCRIGVVVIRGLLDLDVRGLSSWARGGKGTNCDGG